MCIKLLEIKAGFIDSVLYTPVFLNDDLSTPQIVFNKETASYPPSKSSANCEEG